MRGDKTAKFTYEEIMTPGYCIHSVRQVDCPSCIRGTVWYQGRIDGIMEVLLKLAENGAIEDCMRKVVKDMEPAIGTHFHSDEKYEGPDYFWKQT